MQRYQVKDLVELDSQAFRETIQRFLHTRDYASEGYSSADKQRDLSVQFYWGHNHDFAEFYVPGMNGDNHIHLIRTFVEQLKVLPISLAGLRVLDVGCWTGGTSLLLSAMGAEVVAVEEVKKYADCVTYLKRAFDIQKLEPMNLSLFECTTADFQDAFDLSCSAVSCITSLTQYSRFGLYSIASKTVEPVLLKRR